MKKSTDDDTIALLRGNINKRKRLTDATDKKDELKTLVDYKYISILNLSPYRQLRTKREIFNIVNAAKEEELNKNLLEFNGGMN